MYCFIDKYGVVVNMKDGTKVTVFIDALLMKYTSSITTGIILRTNWENGNGHRQK